MSPRISLGMWIILALLAAFVLAAAGADLLATHDPLRQSLLLRLRTPGGAYLLGTDDLGRDLLSRILYGARASILVAALSVSVSLVVGTTLGLLAGWFRGWTAVLIMRFVDQRLRIDDIAYANSGTLRDKLAGK